MWVLVLDKYLYLKCTGNIHTCCYEYHVLYRCTVFTILTQYNTEHNNAILIYLFAWRWRHLHSKRLPSVSEGNHMETDSFKTARASLDSERTNAAGGAITLSLKSSKSTSPINPKCWRHKFAAETFWMRWIRLNPSCMVGSSSRDAASQRRLCCNFSSAHGPYNTTRFFASRHRHTSFEMSKNTAVVLCGECLIHNARCSAVKLQLSITTCFPCRNILVVSSLQLVNEPISSWQIRTKSCRSRTAPKVDFPLPRMPTNTINAGPMLSRDFMWCCSYGEGSWCLSQLCFIFWYGLDVTGVGFEDVWTNCGFTIPDSSQYSISVQFSTRSRVPKKSCRKLWWQISAMCFSGRVESQRLICLEASFAEVLQPAFRGAAHRPSPSCSLTCEKSVLHSIGKQLRCLSSRSVLTGLPWFSTRSKRERGLGKITVSHSEANRLKIWLSPGIALPISQHPVWATTGISSLHAWNEMHAVSRALWTERSKKC